MDSLKNILPDFLTGNELDRMLEIVPEYQSSIRDKSPQERLIALQVLYNIFIPTGMSHEIYSKLYLALMRSIQKKQGILAVRQANENAKMVHQRTYESIIGGCDSFTILGQSGIGKTSSISRAINTLSSDAYLEIGNTSVIPSLQVQCPADSSLKGLLLEILRKTDGVLDTEYYEKAIRSHATTDSLIGTISQVALNHIGLLIIDEIQNVVGSKNGKTIIGALSQLINNSGVSICMVGTPECESFFEQKMMFARRSVGLKFSQWDYSDEFCNFCRTILRYIYVKDFVTIDDSVLLWLYNHSGGNASIVVSLIHDAQEIAILEGYDRLDISSLSVAYERRLSLLHNYISPETNMISRQKKKKMEFTTQIDAVTDTEKIKISEISQQSKKSGNDIVGDLHRAGISILEVAV